MYVSVGARQYFCAAARNCELSMRLKHLKKVLNTISAGTTALRARIDSWDSKGFSQGRELETFTHCY